MKKLLLLISLLLATNAWAQFDIGLKCSDKESKRDKNYKENKILINNQDKKVRYFSIEFYQGDILTPWDNTYSLSKKVEFYSWDTLDMSKYKGRIYDSNGEFTMEAINWVAYANYTTYKLNRETLLLTMDSNKGRNRSISCELATVDEVRSEIDFILKEKKRIKEKERLENIKQDTEQLKKNKI